MKKEGKVGGDSTKILSWKNMAPNERIQFPSASDGKESSCNEGDLGSIPRLGRSPGEGNSYPRQYSGLEDSTDCIVHGVTKSQTRLSNFHFHILLICPSVLLESLKIIPLTGPTPNFHKERYPVSTLPF